MRELIFEYREEKNFFCVISGFHRELDYNCALLGCYAAGRVNLPTLRETTFRPYPQGSSLTTELIGCPETSVRNYQYSLRKNPEERSFLSLSTAEISCAEFCPNPDEESRQQGNV